MPSKKVSAILAWVSSVPHHMLVGDDVPGTGDKKPAAISQGCFDRYRCRCGRLDGIARFVAFEQLRPPGRCVRRLSAFGHDFTFIYLFFRWRVGIIPDAIFFELVDFGEAGRDR